MEPLGEPIRRMRMSTRRARILAAALLTGLVLGGCGDDGDDTATDRPDSPSAEASTEPAPEPGPGAYPEFEPEDYTFTLVVSCFCPDAGVPVRVTVADDKATEAVYARTGHGYTEGDAAPGHRAVTIDEIIAAANDTEAESVEVKWPEGQDYPSQVYVDKSAKIADDEIGYAVKEVEPA